MEYQKFLKMKHLRAEATGFTPKNLNPSLFDWQAKIVEWSCKRGRAALFEDCGLGKTLQQLAWGEQVVRRCTNPLLLVCPIAVGKQTINESIKFGISVDVQQVKQQSEVKPGINITNYERLHLFNCSSFDAVILDESSILKNYTGKIKQQLCNQFKNTKYKLACTATPAPNDRMELGNHSEFLGIMPSNEMLSRWFINDTMKAGGYRLAGHARNDFWRWMSEWSVCISKPSDIGYSDDGYKLPALNIIEHVVGIEDFRLSSDYDDSGVSATKVHKVKRKHLQERADYVASLVNNNNDSWVVWCDTDYEADALVKVIPDAVEVRGSTPEKKREELFESFSDGKERVMISKPEIAGFGLNWQHCHNTTWFAGYSFEKFYQAIRRLYRFGQKHSVECHIIASEQEQSIKKVIDRKVAEFGEFQSEMAKAMSENTMQQLHGRNNKPQSYRPTQKMEVPEWLTSLSV